MSTIILRNVMFLKKINYPRWHLGIKKLSRIALLAWKACNKPRIALVIDLFNATPSRANFHTAVAFSKRV